MLFLTFAVGSDIGLETGTVSSLADGVAGALVVVRAGGDGGLTGEGDGVKLGPVVALALVGAELVQTLRLTAADQPVASALVHVEAAGRGIAGEAGRADAGESAGVVRADGVDTALAGGADGLVALVNV